jgi:hypothetical protein
MGLPPGRLLPLVLEGEPNPEVKLSHRGVGVEAADYAATTTVDAVIGSAEIHLVEDVKCFESELSVHALRDFEVLKEGQIRVEESWACVAVPLPSKVGNLRTLEWTVCLPIDGQWCYRGIEGDSTCYRVEVSHRAREAADYEGTAWPGVYIAAALVVSLAPGQAAAPIGRGVELIASNQ